MLFDTRRGNRRQPASDAILGYCAENRWSPLPLPRWLGGHQRIGLRLLRTEKLESLLSTPVALPFQQSDHAQGPKGHQGNRRGLGYGCGGRGLKDRTETALVSASPRPSVYLLLYRFLELPLIPHLSFIQSGE